MLSAVVFDFDGIIVDTEPIHYRAFQEILAPMGLGFSWEEYLSRYIGFDDRDAFREAFSLAGRSLPGETLKELMGRKARAFQAVVSGGVEPYPGAPELIRAVSGALPLALCSGALLCDIAPILATLGLSDAFDAVVTAEEVAASKPDPESYRLALEKLQGAFPGRELPAAEVVAIEDTPAGIASACGAGLKVLGVTNSYPADRLSGASSVVATLAGLDLERLRLLF